ncbi:MAG: hypothetical protein JWQ16_1332 [Novosphingobium sp.]|nr:hypothetical protein [Novosphingobium sp.]
MTGPIDSPLNADDRRKRIVRGRNIVVGLLLGAFVILVYAISIAKMT